MSGSGPRRIVRQPGVRAGPANLAAVFRSTVSTRSTVCIREMRVSRCTG
jgi:hypothetical protein